MLLPRIILFKFSSKCRQIDFQETVKFQILRLNVTGLKGTIHIFIEMIFSRPKKNQKNFTTKEIIKKNYWKWKAPLFLAPKPTTKMLIHRFLRCLQRIFHPQATVYDSLCACISHLPTKTNVNCKVTTSVQGWQFWTSNNPKRFEQIHLHSHKNVMAPFQQLWLYL